MFMQKNWVCYNTNFINSSGWPEDNHYSTVYDLAILSNALIRDFPELIFIFFKIKSLHIMILSNLIETNYLILFKEVMV